MPKGMLVADMQGRFFKHPPNKKYSAQELRQIKDYNARYDYARNECGLSAKQLTQIISVTAHVKRSG